jgi:glycosyltransferase involved in cell wall biosynthesis
MKVLIISKEDMQGGAFIAAYRVHNALLKNGVDSLMLVDKKTSDDLTVEGPTTKIAKLLANLRPRLINYLLVKLQKTNNKVIHSPSVLPSTLVKCINESDADVINLHWIQNEMLSIKDISKIKKPIVWTFHDMWAFCGAEHYTNDNRWREGYNFNNRPSYERGFDLNKWTWKRKKKYWKNPIQITTPSLWLAKCVNESKLMSNWPVTVVANPLNTEIFKPMDKKNACRKLNLPDKVSLILFGALGGKKDPRKGFDLLISALKQLENQPKAKKIELAIFGQSKPKSSLSLGFPTHYIGHLSNDASLRLAYNAADVMVIPSTQEAFGQTASESISCGTPVVAFGVGGLLDIVDHQINGYLAKPFDTNDLAQGIDWVLNAANYSELCKNARDKALKEFDYKVVAKKYISLYEKTLIY